MSRILITPRSLSSGGHPALAALEEAGFELVMPAPGETPSEAALLDLSPTTSREPSGSEAGVLDLSPPAV